MQAKNEISEELKLLSAVVNAISRETPYKVPAGYFDGFPAILLSLTGETPEAEEPFFASEKDKPLTFSVPEGYFEGFAKGLLDKIKAGNTASTQRPDHTNTQQRPNDINTQQRPDDKGSSDSTLELAQLSPFLNGLSRNTPYQTPEGYFEGLSPIMAALSDVREKPSYAVPDDYFLHLAGEILSKVHSENGKEPARQESLRQEGTPVILMNRTPLQRPWWKYSAAAVVAALIVTLSWLSLHTPSVNHAAPVADVASNLVKISDQDLQNFLNEQKDQNPFADDQNLASDDGSPNAEPANNTATLDITDNDIKSLLGDVPDGELKSYMEEHGGATDIATN